MNLAQTGFVSPACMNSGWLFIPPIVEVDGIRRRRFLAGSQVIAFSPGHGNPNFEGPGTEDTGYEAALVFVVVSAAVAGGGPTLRRVFL